MLSNIRCLCVQIVLIYWISFVNAVPPDYCLQTLNTSDCKGPPTPVFHYYKPGSRCELGIWKGCPTQNKFDDEYLCSHHCIFRFIKQDAVSDNLIDYTDQCSKTITENICKDKKQNVAYTYNEDQQDCIPIVWGDCKSPNIFKEIQTCIDTCVTDWHDEINNLTEDEVKEIDKLLDDVTSNVTTEGSKHLKLKDDDETTVAGVSPTVGPTADAPTTVSENLVPEAKNSTEVPAAPDAKTTIDPPTTTIRIKGTAKEVLLPGDV